MYNSGAFAKELRVSFFAPVGVNDSIGPVWLDIYGSFIQHVTLFLLGNIGGMKLPSLSITQVPYWRAKEPFSNADRFMSPLHPENFMKNQWKLVFMLGDLTWKVWKKFEENFPLFENFAAPLRVSRRTNITTVKIVRTLNYSSSR